MSTVPVLKDPTPNTQAALTGIAADIPNAHATSAIRRVIRLWDAVLLTAPKHNLARKKLINRFIVHSLILASREMASF
jgi:hypothetical protein